MTEQPEQPDEPEKITWVRWYIKYRLLNGVEGCYPISIEEKDSLWKRIPRNCEHKGLKFFEFDSLTHCILIQCSQLVFYQFLFEPLIDIDPKDLARIDAMNKKVDEDDRASYAVKIYSTDRAEPMIFYVNNEPDPNDEGDEGEMGNFIFDAIHINEEEPWLHLTDEDGETAFFQGSAIALVEVPLKVLYPEEDDDEDDEEGDG